MRCCCHDVACSALQWAVLGSLQWRYNERGGVQNHRRLDCFLNRWFRRRSKIISKHPSLSFVRGIHRWLVDFPHKAPAMQKMFPFDDVIMPSIFFWMSAVHEKSAYKHDKENYPRCRCFIVQDCGISIVNALEILQSYTKPSIYSYNITGIPKPIY